MDRIERIIEECDMFEAEHEMCCTLAEHIEQIRQYAKLVNDANVCELCGKLIADEHVHESYNGGIYCGCCVEEAINAESPIRSYHENKGTYSFRTNGEDAPKNYRGLEIEIETGLNTEVFDVLEGYADFFVYETDGSLSEGFEAITHPMSQDYWNAVGYDKINALIFDLKSVTDDMRAWNGGNCGLHIHFNRCEWSWEAQEFLKDFVVQNHLLLRKLCGRDDFGYCRLPNNSDYYTDDNGVIYNSSRYLALNFTRNTIEFRLWRGTLKPEFIWASTEVSEAMLEFAEFAVSETGINLNIRPNEEDFVEFCRIRYPDVAFFKNARRKRFNRHYGYIPSENWE